VKLHDLKPAAGAHKKKTRVGRGIAAGKGKTAGRGTKGQKARAGGTIPAWFEGGQTPLHQRLPKLHGFKNPFRIEYEIVNIGDVARLVELGVLEGGEMPGAKPSKAKAAAPITVNQEILRATGLVRTLDRPLKVLGSGELSTALFVVADAFSASARAKIEAAGGTASVLETTGRKTPSIGVETAAPAAEASIAPAAPEADADEAPATAEEAPAETPAEPVAKPAAKAKATAASKPAAKAKPESKPAAKAAPAKPRAAKTAAADGEAKPKSAARKKAAPADAPDEPGNPA
jgi:large subunit ribosomal protein L15